MNMYSKEYLTLSLTVLFLLVFLLPVCVFIIELTNITAQINASIALYFKLIVKIEAINDAIYKVSFNEDIIFTPLNDYISELLRIRVALDDTMNSFLVSDIDLLRMDECFYESFYGYKDKADKIVGTFTYYLSRIQYIEAVIESIQHRHLISNIVTIFKFLCLFILYLLLHYKSL